MGKIIYVVTIEEVCDLDEFPHKPRAFSKKEDALNFLKSTYEEVKDDFDESYTKEYEDGDEGATIYKEGYWSSDRWVITMSECELDADI